MKNQLKTSHTFICVIAALAYLPLAQANNVPTGLTAGTHNLAIGDNSFASGTGSQATGHNAIATGGNIPAAQFQSELAAYQALIQQIQQTEQAIANKNGEINQNAFNQRHLQQQIDYYTRILANAQNKIDKINTLNTQKTEQEQFKQQYETELSELQTAFNRNSFTSGDKRVYQNFSNIMKTLDWSKLQHADGKQALVQDLKTGVEKDFAGINISNEKYERMINGYLNHQGNLQSAETTIKQKITEQLDGTSFSVGGTQFHVSESVSHMSHAYPHFNQDVKPSVWTDIGFRLNSNETAHSLIDKMLSNKSFGFNAAPSDYDGAIQDWHDAKHIYVARMIYERTIKELSEKNNAAAIRLVKGHSSLEWNRYVLRDPSQIGFLFQLAPLKQGEFGQHYIADETLILTTKALADSNIDTRNLNNHPHNINSIQNIKKYIDNIDYDTDEWLFDKNEHKAFVDNHLLPYYKRVKTILDKAKELESTTLTQAERDAISGEIIVLRQQLKADYVDNPNAIYRLSQFKPNTLKQEVYDTFNEVLARYRTLEQEASILQPYNNDELTEIKTALSAEEQKLSLKQQQIANVNRQIEQLSRQLTQWQLTAEEQQADPNRQALTQQLNAKVQELAQLNADLNAHRHALLGLNNELNNSPLGKKGQDAIAEGSHAFASGNSTIAIGANSQAIGDDAVAMGHHAQALKNNAIAVGKNAIANAEKAIALGDAAGVSGKQSIAIGAGGTVTGDNSVSMGANSVVTGNNVVSLGANNVVAHDDAVALGTNISKTASNSVNLGAKSAAEVNKTAQTAGTSAYSYTESLGKEYTFAGANAVGVVTLGDVGSERRLQNVAAGLIEVGSTDAVNGSQLYRTIQRMNNGSIGVVRQNPTSQEIEVGTHLDGDTVNFANKSGENRRIIGVANGVEAHDAVNVQQLNQSFQVIDARVLQVENRLGKAEHEVNKVKRSVSTAVAMANMPSASLAGQNMLSVGTGYVNDTSAIAVGLSGVTESGKFSYKFSGGVSQNSQVAVGAGMGFAW